MTEPAAAPEAATRPAGNGAGINDDGAWAAQAKASLGQVEARLARRFEQDNDTTVRSVALRARAADHVLKEAWARCIPADAPLALFAVGGYGRGELFPQSDVDVLVLGEPKAQQAQHEALARFFALLWNAGLAISHAVRSAAECTQASAD